MSRLAILLRGVNVGGRTKLAMADLRSAIAGAGFEDVQTYLQSGNAVLTTPGGLDPDVVAARVRAALAAEVGLDTGVLARTGAELAAIVAANPYPDLVETPTMLHVAFLSHRPDRAGAEGIDPSRLGPDRFSLGDRCAYLAYVTSPGRSRLAEIVTRAVLPRPPAADVTATTRNWNTVRALAERTRG